MGITLDWSKCVYSKHPIAGLMQREDKYLAGRSDRPVVSSIPHPLPQAAFALGYLFDTMQNRKSSINESLNESFNEPFSHVDTTCS